MDPYVLARNLIYRMTSPLCLPYTIFLIVMGTVLYYKVLPIVTRMLACGVAVRVSTTVDITYAVVCLCFSVRQLLCSYLNLLCANNRGYHNKRCCCPCWGWSETF